MTEKGGFSGQRQSRYDARIVIGNMGLDLVIVFLLRFQYCLANHQG
jgi:hypothetical protein